MVGVSFIPLVVESLGGWSDEAADTIASIGRLLGQRLGIPPAETIRHLFQRCSIALWRGNAALWIRHCPVHLPSVDGALWLFFVLVLLYILSCIVIFPFPNCLTVVPPLYIFLIVTGFVYWLYVLFCMVPLCTASLSLFFSSGPCLQGPFVNPLKKRFASRACTRTLF